jgi:hypothetical protein
VRTAHHLGKLVIGVGLVTIAAGFIVPAEATPIGPDPCPANYPLVAKFEFKEGTYVFEKPAGNETVVTISEANAQGGTWDSGDVLIGVVTVKGGSGDDAFYANYLVPPATQGTFDNSELTNPGGQVPDISFVAFCGPFEEPTTPTSTETTPDTTPTSTASSPTSETPQTTPASVAGVSITAAPPTTAAEVLGVQLARTGFSAGLLLVGAALIALGLVFELGVRRLQAPRG